MPEPSQSLSAVIVSGGKQYRVAPGDRILVDRLAAEAGSELELDRVLMVADGDDVKVGGPGIDGMLVTARVLGDRRGPKIDVLRYKSKKRVRVHRGARADLTALEILSIGGKGAQKAAKAAAKSEAPAEARADKPARSRAKAQAQAAGAETTAAPAETASAPARARRTRVKAETAPEEATESDGA